MLDRTIKKIFKSIEKLNKFSDKHRLSWADRVLAGYKAFRAFDRYRFELTPADPEGTFHELEDAIDFLKRAADKNIPNQISIEKELEDRDKRMQYLYGLAWSQQSDEEYYHGATHFADRLINSNLDISFLKGAKCLDLGTGHGRYALAMIQLGARNVTGIDFSTWCLDEAKRRLKHYPKEENKIKLIHKSVYKLLKSMNNSYDVVLANGFIHHLPDPEGAFKVMYKTMKRGGYGFTFVFSDEGRAPWWRAIDFMRKVVADVPIWYSHKILEACEVPGNKKFNFLDYSYTPIQFRFKRRWVERTLKRIGFKNLEFLEGGVIHDSVLRSRLFDTDKALYGDAEIRYLMRK